MRAALLCCVLLAASLPLGQRSAQATAAAVDVDRLLGPTRYETAVAIAERFLDEASFPVVTAIVVSGEDEHAACALPAATLAAHRRAPILLTSPGVLPLAAERFLDDHGIRRVLIVGGSAQVSPVVADRLAQLTEAAPRRFGGVSCSEVALSVAANLHQPDLIPGLRRTAILATSESPADGLAAGPLAYQGRFPLLLTDGGELDAGVQKLLDERADHVIILGGPAAVTEYVELQLHTLGITTERWYGPDRYATAARIAAELLNDAPPVRCFNGDSVGLATGFAPADAIASAPLLGERCAPLLLTGRDSLPRQTAAALRSEAFGGDDAGVLRLAVFGGTAAISASTERAAVEAAGNAGVGQDDLATVTISAAEGACHWTVNFSEPVLVADAAQIGNYTHDQNPLPARLAEIHAGDGVTTKQAVVLLAGAGAYTNAEVPTGCVAPVAVRDRLGVIGGAIRSATGNRKVGAHELIVRADTIRPSLKVLAPPGRDTIWVRSNEPLAAGSVIVTLTRGRVRKTQTVTIAHGDTRFAVSFVFPEHDSYDTADRPFTEPPWLAPADRITIPAGKLRDRAGNLNTSVTHPVAADNSPPRAAAVFVSLPFQRPDGTMAVDITVRWSEPVQGCDLGPAGEMIELGDLQIDVDGDGFVEYALDGTGAAAAGVTFVDAPDGNPWVLPSAAACDQYWPNADGTLVARLVANTPTALPRSGSRLTVGAGAVHDFVGNPSLRHMTQFLTESPLRG